MKNNRSGAVPILLMVLAVLVVGGLGYLAVKQYGAPSAEPPADQPPPIVGGDRDASRCIGSAGYSWCEAKQKCLRVWEEACEAIPTVDTSGWKTYRNEQYGFEFRYSNQNTKYINDVSVFGAGAIDSYRCPTSNDTSVNGTKYDIENVFHLDIRNCEQMRVSIDDYAKESASHALNPPDYNPTIAAVNVSGAEGRLITSKNPQYIDAELVILSPQPITVNGEDWGIVVIHSSATLMQQILSTFKFIEPTSN